MLKKQASTKSDNSYRILLENQRLKTVIRVQKHILGIQARNAYSNWIGNILIVGMSSTKLFLVLPIKLILLYLSSLRTSPPDILGGKSFSKVILAWKKGGMHAVDALLDTCSLLPRLRADAYTTLARHIMKVSAVKAIHAARRAYEIDPRPYRLKWLAFREYEAGDAIRAAAMLDILPLNTQMSLSESHLLANIQLDMRNSIFFQHYCEKNKAIHAKSFSSKTQNSLRIDSYDNYKDTVCIFYDTNKVLCEEFFIDKHECLPVHIKTMRNDSSAKYDFRRYIVIPLGKNYDETLLSATIGNKIVPFVFQKMHYATVPIGVIRAVLNRSQVSNVDSPYTDCWLFIDRDIQADDNAEHLYRYVAQHHPEIKSFFALRENSHDWQRLFEEGFRLIPWGSPQYDEALMMCKKIISSHINTDMIRTREGKKITKQYIFLQHGITMNDLSLALNKHTIDLFITVTNAEFQTIAGDNSHYKFGINNVRCLGFPRHDALLENDIHCQRQILVMPTWRRRIVGNYIEGFVRSINPNFSTSHYLQAWSSFLCSERLHYLATKYNYSIVFSPHSMMQPYMHEFRLPAHIRTVLHADSGIQTLFKSSALMITDFSSVAFEMAYLQRPVIYYQFDEDEFFAEGTKQWQKGYFNYREHGFGPVITDENALLNSLENLLSRDATSEDIYLERINTTFAYRDRNNCTRVFEAICDLDKPYPDGYVNIDILRAYTRIAIENNATSVALSRAVLLHSLDNTEDSLQLVQEAKALHVREA